MPRRNRIVCAIMCDAGKTPDGTHATRHAYSTRWVLAFAYVFAAACVSTTGDPSITPGGSQAAGGSPGPATTAKQTQGRLPPPSHARTDASGSPRPKRDKQSQGESDRYEPLHLNDEQLQRARTVQPLVAAAADRHSIDPNLLNGIIWTESKFNPKARNKRSGARGLMQLMPGTSKAMAKKLGVASRPYNPSFATQAGAKLLSIHASRFDNDETLMLFAYARGGGSVRKWQKTSAELPKGVQMFIRRVQRARATFATMGFPDLQAPNKGRR